MKYKKNREEKTLWDNIMQKCRNCGGENRIDSMILCDICDKWVCSYCVKYQGSNDKTDNEFGVKTLCPECSKKY